MTGLAGLLGTSAPAWAESAGTSVPAPSALTLLALGVAGLLIGRYGSRRPPSD
ncbi:MAG: PEP-CTERM sorting domain-containing protein [Novosphingobium sp.]|nr:PEP-CTERM sorting domain-containing protein [Novosphingobium sp.]MBK9012142.1 PEP-CTERM sorting domain-containing protein [Novosphingobium sp.]